MFERCATKVSTDVLAQLTDTVVLQALGNIDHANATRGKT